MNITLTIDDSQAHTLISRAPNDISVAMRGGMEDATTFLLARMKRYPAPPPRSTYTRTHVLEKSWSRRITGSGSSLVGQVGSSGAMAPYNRQVQDREHQASAHRGRWHTIQDVAEEETPRVRRMFEDRLEAVGR